ncbi:MAG: phosphate signaling complex protein PhoU [Candidatus Thermoplasmatota archaeon]|nr:phosphate signaling complex protein PhoU [Candidatus Thermoplasmatota archaeon]
MGTREKFDEDINEVYRMLGEMRDLAIDSINSAMDALEKLEEDAAKVALRNDVKSYDLMRSIENKCTALLMLQAPVAKDLRKIVTAMKSSGDLNRIIRYARNISKLAIEMVKEKDGHFKKLIGLEGMKNKSIDMIEKAMKALLEENKNLALEVYREEEDVDALYEQIFRELITYMVEDNRKITRGVRYLLAGRYLERVADHTCNIAEGAIYTSTGERIAPD